MTIKMLDPGEIDSRFGYHKATDETGPIHSEVRKLFIRFANELNEMLPVARPTAVAFTELESASMWAHKAISENAPLVKE